MDLRRRLILIRRRYSAHRATIRATKNHRRRTLEIPQLLAQPLEPLTGDWSATATVADGAPIKYDEAAPVTVTIGGSCLG